MMMMMKGVERREKRRSGVEEVAGERKDGKKIVYERRIKDVRGEEK